MLIQATVLTLHVFFAGPWEDCWLEHVNFYLPEQLNAIIVD